MVFFVHLQRRFLTGYPHPPAHHPVPLSSVQCGVRQVTDRTARYDGTPIVASVCLLYLGRLVGSPAPPSVYLVYGKRSDKS